MTIWIVLLISSVFNIVFLLYTNFLQGRLDWHREKKARLLAEAPDTATYTWVDKVLSEEEK